MMGIYDPNTVHSSIDTMGRYAFGNQPEIARWNLARLAECLLPLINSDTDTAIEMVTPILDDFVDKFQTSYMEMMSGKCGFISKADSDNKIITSLLAAMQKNQLDYTRTFDLLTKSVSSKSAADDLQNSLGNSFDLWSIRINNSDQTDVEIETAMRRYNPVVIPRNHHVEHVLRECELQNSGEPAEHFLQVLRTPYQETEKTVSYQDLPEDGDKNYRTFCGT
jgi:uncharacterized protein YdiU (UPF0061 family)